MSVLYCTTLLGGIKILKLFMKSWDKSVLPETNHVLRDWYRDERDLFSGIKCRDGGVAEVSIKAYYLWLSNIQTIRPGQTESVRASPMKGELVWYLGSGWQDAGHQHSTLINSHSSESINSCK